MENNKNLGIKPIQGYVLDTGCRICKNNYQFTKWNPFQKKKQTQIFFVCHQMSDKDHIILN